MKTQHLTTAILACAMAAVPLTSQATNSTQGVVDACAKAFVASLAAHYESNTQLRETRYPRDGIMPFGSSDLVLIATNPRAGAKFVSRARCRVSTTGEIISLQTEEFAAL